MSRSTATMLTKKPLILALIAAFAVIAIVVPARVLAHTPEGGHPTSTTVACAEGELLYSETTPCVLTVTDLTQDETEVTSPVGSVVIESNRDGDIGTCTLVASGATAGSCAVAAVTGSPGTHALTVRYEPEAAGLHSFAASEAATTLVVSGGAIVIEKETVGAAGTSNFTLTAGDTVTPFDLETATTGAAGVDSQLFDDLTPGTFTVVESEAAGWALTDLACTIEAEGTAQSGAVASITDRKVIITVAAGETVTCRFENSRHGAINIIKSSGDADGTFAFTATGGLAGNAFTIATTDGTGNLVTSNLQPGTYTVTEAGSEGWELASIECTASAGSSTSVGGNTATIALAANGTVTCTFANEMAEDEEPVVEACAGPAAPAIAAAYLKAQGIKPGGPGRVNLIASVATQLGGPHATIDGLTKCDDGYAAAVEAFLDAAIDAQGLTAGAQAEAEAEVDAEVPGAGGPPSWAPGPPPWAGGGQR